MLDVAKAPAIDREQTSSFRRPAIGEPAVGADPRHGVHLVVRHVGREILRDSEPLAILIQKQDIAERRSFHVVGTETAPHRGQRTSLSQHKTSGLYLICLVGQGGEQGLGETPD